MSADTRGFISYRIDAVHLYIALTLQSIYRVAKQHIAKTTSNSTINWNLPFSSFHMAGVDDGRLGVGNLEGGIFFLFLFHNASSFLLCKYFAEDLQDYALQIKMAVLK